MVHQLQFLDDPVAFLEAAGEHLAGDPVRSTVLSTFAERSVRERAAGVAQPDGFPRWWLVVRDASGAVVGAGMRTAPFEPHPPYLVAMPDAAARQLAVALHARSEELAGVNGALPAARIVAEEYAALTGRTARVHEHTRLFELGDLVDPARPPGRLRPATPADLDLALDWYLAFGREAAEQAGRGPDDPHAMFEDEAGMLRRIEAGRVWFWVDEAGERVHLTGHSETSFGVARVGPVFTPRERRGHGYAGAAVAEVSRMLRDDGARVTLFTDQANPVSNALYQRLGYRPVVDQANLVIA
ncbi:MAG TPA: GNAT family N-acetyltransferase [Marmoricola sp.]|nr:GNAT family N-acetyltransferase [Marmoricola sp.]